MLCKVKQNPTNNQSFSPFFCYPTGAFVLSTGYPNGPFGAISSDCFLIFLPKITSVQVFIVKFTLSL